MKKCLRGMILMIITVFFCAFSVACTSKKDPVADPSATLTPGPDDKEDPHVTSYMVDNSEVSKIGYYTVDSGGKIKSATSLITNTTKITPKLILGYFVDSLEDESIELSIKDVQITESLCVIDFDDSIYDIASMGKKIENAVLDAAAQSILDNIDEVEGVGFSINGKAYSTTNNKFALNSVYMGK